MTPDPASSIPARPGRYLLWFGLALALLVSANLLLAWTAFGRPNLRSLGACPAVAELTELSLAIPSPKLVLIGGSGTKRGVNAERLAAALGMPVVNFGLQAGLGPEILLGEARGALRPGDTALLLFEFNAYDYDAPSSVALEFVSGCRQRYFEEATIERKLVYLLGMSPDLMLESFQDNEKKRERRPQRAVCEDGLASVGDLPFDERAFPPMTDLERERLSLYKPLRIRVDTESFGAAAIADFVRWAREEGIKVLASWPNTIDFPAYKEEASLGEIADFYQRLGVPVVGEPSDAFLPMHYFHDTLYHLQPEGIVLRTQRLAPLLRPHLEESIEEARAKGPSCPAPD